LENLLKLASYPGVTESARYLELEDFVSAIDALELAAEVVAAFF